MYEDHFQTDGVNDAVETVLWEKLYHDSTCSETGSPGGPEGSISEFPLYLVLVVISLGLILIIRKKSHFRICR